MLYSRYLLCLIGTLGGLCLGGHSAIATELGTEKTAIFAESNSQSSAVPEAVPQESPAPVAKPAAVSEPDYALETEDSRTIGDQSFALETEDYIDEQRKLNQQVVVQQTQSPVESYQEPISDPVITSTPEYDSPPVEEVENASVALESTSNPVSPNPAEELLIVAQAPVKPNFSSTPSSAKSNQKSASKKLDLAQLSFNCGTEKDAPTTIAKIGDRSLGVILWESTVFTAKGYTPETRCKHVTARFATYQKAEGSTYLTTGKLNGQSIICVTAKEGGGCGDGVSNYGLLFTLKPTSDAQATLEQLSNVLTSEANTSAAPLKE